MSRRARERMDAERVSGSLEPFGSDEEAYTGSVGIPIQADAYADTLPSAAPTEAPQAVGYDSNPYATAGDTYGTESEMREENPAELYRS